MTNDVKERRAELGLSQGELAAALGLDVGEAFISPDGKTALTGSLDGTAELAELAAAAGILAAPVLYVNPALAQMHGYRPADLIEQDAGPDHEHPGVPAVLPRGQPRPGRGGVRLLPGRGRAPPAR